MSRKQRDGRAIACRPDKGEGRFDAGRFSNCGGLTPIMSKVQCKYCRNDVGSDHFIFHFGGVADEGWGDLEERHFECMLRLSRNVDAGGGVGFVHGEAELIEGVRASQHDLYFFCNLDCSLEFWRRAHLLASDDVHKQSRAITRERS